MLLATHSLEIYRHESWGLKEYYLRGGKMSRGQFKKLAKIKPDKKPKVKEVVVEVKDHE